VKKPLGYQKTSGAAAAKTLADLGPGGAIPAGATFAYVQAETQDVRWRDDGTSPTATDGILLTAGDVLIVDRGQLNVIEFIEVAATAVLHVSFYKDG